MMPKITGASGNANTLAIPMMPHVGARTSRFLIDNENVLFAVIVVNPVFL